MKPNVRQFYLTVLSTAIVILNQECLCLKPIAMRVPAVVKAGDTVTFVCEYDAENDPLYSIKWYQTKGVEFYRYVPSESVPNYKIFSLKYVDVDASKSGENFVTLKDVPRQLEGNYTCQVSGDAPIFQEITMTSHMIVVELPTDHPVLIVGPREGEVGKKMELECVSPKSYPAANLTWFINDQQVKHDTDNITVQTNQTKEGFSGLLVTRSKIQFVIDKSDFIQSLMKIRCTGSIFTLWKEWVEESIKDETPKPKLVELTSSSTTLVAGYIIFIYLLYLLTV